MARKPRKAAKRKTVTVNLTGEKAPRGVKMTLGSWHLMPKTGRKRVFTGTLIDTVNAKEVRLAIFRVPK